MKVVSKALGFDHGMVRLTCATMLEKIKSELFKPEVEMTLVVRLPGDQGCDIVVTKDDISEVISVLERAAHERT